MKKAFVIFLFSGLVILLPHAAYADTVVFTDTCSTNPAAAMNLSTSITVGTSWSSRITLDGSPTATFTNGTTNCGGSAANTNLGFGHTMTPAATTHQYFVDFIWRDLGTVAAGDAIGAIVNYIDSSNYYACVTNDDASGAVDAYIVKMSSGGNSTLATGSNITVTMNGDTLICRIDYTGANPVISFRDATDSVILAASTTDSSSPLSYSGTSGVLVGATPARTNDDVAALGTVLAIDQIRLVESTVVVPTVTTSAASAITPSSATLNGNITNTGGANSTTRGLVWGTSSTLQDAFATSSESGSFGISSFSLDVRGLIAGTTYYFRSYATNSAGTGYSAITSFVAGTDTSTVRSMILFQGFTIKLLESGTIKLFQRVYQ